MAWYFQTSPHDTHDWDSAQTPILIDGVINGKRRKLVSTAARNGYFFTLDRVTGEHIVTSKYGLATNWAKEVCEERVARDAIPTRMPSVGGALVSPTAGGTINWEPPAYSPDTGLFYVSERNGYSIFYLTDPDPARIDGPWRQGRGRTSASAGNFLTAIDYKTGKIAWRRPYPGVVAAAVAADC